MTYHLYFIWIVIHCLYTEAIMFLIIELLLLKMDFMYFVYFMCVEVMCVHRATWENSQWLNVLPCINILGEKKKKKKKRNATEVFVEILDHVDGLVQERHNSIANALELRFSCTNPWMCMNMCHGDITPHKGPVIWNFDVFCVVSLSILLYQLLLV